MSNITLDLKCVSQHIGAIQLGNNIEANLKEYFQYAFLTIGGFTNVNIPQSGIYGGDFSRLRPIDDPNYNDGIVWGSRKQWVYESGTSYTDTTGGLHYPQTVSGITVDGVPNTGYSVDYNNGQIIFNSPVSGTIKANYSFRSVQLYKASETPWWLELQEDSFRIDKPQYLQSESGLWSMFAHNRVQLPAIILQTVPVGQNRGYQLGGQTLIVNREIEFVILSDNIIERNNLADIVNLQSDTKIPMFDINTVDYPLNYLGELTGSTTYTGFLEQAPYVFHSMFLKDSRIMQVKPITPRLFMTIVRTQVECQS